MSERVIRELPNSISFLNVMKQTLMSVIALPQSTALSVPVSRDEYQLLCCDVKDLKQVALGLNALFIELKREQTLQTQLLQRQIELMESLSGTRTESKSPILLMTNPPVLTAGICSQETAEARQVPSPPNPLDEEGLSKAHDWFQQRLIAFGSSHHR